MTRKSRIVAWRTSTSSVGICAWICMRPAPARIAPKSRAARMIANGSDRARRATEIESKPTVVPKLDVIEWVTPRRTHDAGESGEGAGRGHREGRDRAGPHAGVAGGVRVGADRPDLEAPGRPVQEEPDEDDARERDEDPDVAVLPEQDREGGVARRRR